MSSPRGPRAVLHGEPLILRHAGHRRQRLRPPESKRLQTQIHLAEQKDALGPGRRPRPLEIETRSRHLGPRPRKGRPRCRPRLPADSLLPRSRRRHLSSQARARTELADVVASSQDDELFYYGGLDLGNHVADDRPGTDIVSRHALETEDVRCDRKIIVQPCWKPHVETGRGDGVPLPGERRRRR